MWFKASLGIMLATGIMLQGCGRKGPLRLPVPVAHTAVQPLVSQSPAVSSVSAVSTVPATQ